MDKLQDLKHFLLKEVIYLHNPMECLRLRDRIEINHHDDLMKIIEDQLDM